MLGGAGWRWVADRKKSMTMRTPHDPFGADLRGASLKNCNLAGCDISYADVSGCDFSGSNMVGCLLYRSETQRAKFNNVVLSEESDVPKIKVFQTGRVTA